MIISIIKQNKKLKLLITFVFWILLWQIMSLIVHEELLIPSPWTVTVSAVLLLKTSGFWLSAGASLLRIVAGFLAGLTVGCILAFITSKLEIINMLISPIMHIIRAAPVASFIILALLWIQTNFLPAFISFLMVTPLVWDSMQTGIQKIDPSILEMAKVFRLSKAKTFFFVKIPSLFPFFISSCITGIGFAWKSGIAAEIICRPVWSIGRQLQDAKTYLETPQVFAWTALIIVLSLILEKFLLYIFRHISNIQKYIFKYCFR